MRINASQAAKRLLEQDDILLICHRDPDGDTLGSAAALWEALTNLGKRAGIWCSTESPVNLRFLSRETPSFEPKFRVTIDTASIKLLGDGEIRNTHVDLCIDHHPSNTLYADETFLADSASAGEAVLELLREMNCAITPSMATALFAAISSDTGSFKYSSTTDHTLQCGADLLRAGADKDLVRVNLYESKSRAQVLVESAALAGCEFYNEGRLAVVSVPIALLERFGADESELESLAAKPIEIVGVDIAITIKERPDGSVRVSVRTSERANACIICEVFEGGGHLRAAGCRLYGTLEECRQKLIAEAQKQL